MKQKCKHCGVCGGCEMLTVSYAQQLHQKTKYVQGLFNKAGLKTMVENTIGMSNPYFFRNKLHLAFGYSKGKTSIGFYKRNSKEVIDIDDCVMHGEWMSKILKVFHEFVKRFRISVYDLKKRSGILRYVVARNVGESVIVTLVTTSVNFPGKAELFRMLKNEFLDVSLYLNINNRTDSAVFGDKFIHINGGRALNVEFMGVKFTLSPKSFMQTNLEIAERVYKMAIESMQIKDIDIILDLFCGIGITSLIFARNGARVISIESERSSVLDAIKMQKENNLQDKIKCICGRCEDKINKACAELKGKQVSVFLDPSRMGVAPVVLKQILSKSPKQIIYLSCNCETLVRDLKTLCKNGQYKIDYVRPFDMFPHTSHIEILVALSQK